MGTFRLDVDNPLGLTQPLDRIIRVALLDDRLPHLFIYRGYWFVLESVEVNQVTSDPPWVFSPHRPMVIATFKMGRQA